MNIDTPRGMRDAVAWQKRLVATLNHGGMWIVPRSFSVFTIDHENKTATKLGGEPEPAIARVFEEMGWKVIQQQETE